MTENWRDDPLENTPPIRCGDSFKKHMNDLRKHKETGSEADARSIADITRESEEKR